MEKISQYLIGVIGAAILCAVSGSLIKKCTTVAGICKLICAVFLSFTVLSPVVKLQISELAMYISGISLEADNIVSSGEAYAASEKEKFIKDKCLAYILDKAASMDVSISAQVFLDQKTCEPTSAILSGEISPYKKTQLAQYIEQTLGIPKEAQTWN